MRRSILTAFRGRASADEDPADRDVTSAEPAPAAPETARDDHFTVDVERAYLMILGRQADPAGAAAYLRGLRSGELTMADVCASLAGSAEFADRLRPDEAATVRESAPDLAETDPDHIDVAELIEKVTVEELAERAEGYFRALDDPDQLLTKPFKAVGEAPDLLVTFGQVLRGLRPLPGMRVLDFGAGTGWTTRFLTQLGCRVLALDVSPTALDLGRELFERQPVLGERPDPEFLVFDGRRIDLPDASVDRVLSFDAFHHVPNPAEVIAEMARVLRPGGIAAFAEPGARHSVQPQSQYEMRHFGVIENDVLIDEVWDWAQHAGFAELRLCLLDSSPRWVDIQTFHDVVAGRERDSFVDPTRAAIGDRRMFWLRKEGAEEQDSRVADGLIGELDVSGIALADDVIAGRCRICNTGTRTWLPADSSFGAVRLGVRAHLGDHTSADVARIPLPGDGVPVGAEVTVDVRVEVPRHPAGVVAVEFDLISEDVCWFSVNGSRVATFTLP